MNILWITLESILPANSGGRLGVIKRLEQVAKTETIYLFYPYDDESELEKVEELKKYCREVHYYRRSKNKSHALKNLWKYPYTIASREIPAMKEDIEVCIKNNSIDIVNVDFPHMVVNLLNLHLDIPIILNEHNIEWKVYKMISKSHKNYLKKFMYWFDSYRLRRFEDRILKTIHFYKITFVSSKDMMLMLQDGKCSKEQAELIPIGADIKLEIVEQSHEGKNIIFVGKMSYAPNIEAVQWFVNDIFPLILEKEPDTKFYIVGKEPTDYIRNLSSDRVYVTGIVDSVEEYYGLADLVVLPLKHGDGVKVKLLEAISYKKPIVSTSVGVEGTIYSDGACIPVADKHSEFAKRCIEALNGKYRDKMEKAYEKFVNQYTWSMIGKKYVNMMKLVISNTN